MFIWILLLSMAWLVCTLLLYSNEHCIESTQLMMMRWSSQLMRWALISENLSVWQASRRGKLTTDVSHGFYGVCVDVCNVSVVGTSQSDRHQHAVDSCVSKPNKRRQYPILVTFISLYFIKVVFFKPHSAILPYIVTLVEQVVSACWLLTREVERQNTRLFAYLSTYFIIKYSLRN